MNRYFTTAMFVVLSVAPARAMTNDPAAIVALVKTSPQLKIDSSIPPPGDWDPKTHPYVALSHGEGIPGGNIDFESASLGRLDDGTQVLAIPLQSGGSGGVFTQILFAQAPTAAKPVFVGAITSGGHLTVNVTYHGIVAIRPLYGPNDQSCCPKQYQTITYTIVNGALKVVSQKTSAKP
jgi:hypothetical protein